MKKIITTTGQGDRKKEIITRDFTEREMQDDLDAGVKNSAIWATCIIAVFYIVYWMMVNKGCGC